MTNIIPLSGGANTASWAYDEASAASFGELVGLFRRAMPGYFRTLGIPLLKGRDFVDDDVHNDRYVLIVSQAMADRAWPGESPIGKQVLIDFRTPSGMTELRETEVIGLVPNTRERTLRGEEPPVAYMPYWSNRFGRNVVVRTSSGDPMALVGPIRALADELGSGRPVRNARRLDAFVADATRSTRFILSLIGLFSALAVFLASLGIYGVIAQLVGQRRREIGLRLALGAQRGEVRRMVLKSGAWLGSDRARPGLGLRHALTRFLGRFLYGVEPWDPLTFVSVGVLLLGVAAAACLLPAARASRVDPATVLRYE